MNSRGILGLELLDMAKRRQQLRIVFLRILLLGDRQFKYKEPQGEMDADSSQGRAF